jgi:hypothetical protein
MHFAGGSCYHLPFLFPYSCISISYYDRFISLVLFKTKLYRDSSLFLKKVEKELSWAKSNLT